jgi:hypothetical protein
MTRPLLLTIACASLLVLAGASSPTAATEVVVRPSFPAVFTDGPPTDPSLEGSVTVTAEADAPITPVTTPPWLQQEGPTTWFTVFRWYENDPRIARFVDAASDTHEVIFAPTPRMPYDPAAHDLPVLSIETDAANLWDAEIGIYAWGNHQNFLQRGEEWERPATLSYRDANGSEVFSEPIGLRINGESSRSYAQKGLRMYFDDYGASDWVEHDFFGDGPVRCERLVLRNNAYADFAIGSGLAEPLHRELGNPGSRWAYTAVYLNGEYWGAYSLRERFDDKWVETTHDWADDDYVVIKDHDAVAGDYGQWEGFLAGCQPPGDFDAHAWFQWLDGQLDIESYVDWLLINACGETADNMAGKNLAILRLGGDRFRWMTWDEDILYQVANRDADHFSFYAAGDYAEFILYEPPVWYSGGPYPFIYSWNNLLRAGMQNAEFKARFRQRAAALLAGPLSADSLGTRLDALMAIQAPEWENHQERWSYTISYLGKAAIVRGQFAYRRDKVGELLDAFFDTWADAAELSAFAIAELEQGVALSWRTEREDDCVGWIVQRRDPGAGFFVEIASHHTEAALVGQGSPDRPAEYAYLDTTAPAGVELSYRLAHEESGGATIVHDWIEHLAPAPVFGLRLNEFLASNDTTLQDEFGDWDDWVELVNIGDAPAPLAGAFLSDNLDNPSKWALPDITLTPGEFLLVWCDEDLEQGPLHASFKLDADGEELGLFAGFAHDNLAIDTVVFGPQQTDVSLGREFDGEGDWVLFATPTPGATNAVSTAVGATAPGVVGLLPPWPNPASGEVAIRARLPRDATAATLRVYDLKGALVRELRSAGSGATERSWRWDGRDATGRPASAGVYLLRLESGGEVSQRRLVLVR